MALAADLPSACFACLTDTTVLRARTERRVDRAYGTLDNAAPDNLWYHFVARDGERIALYRGRSGAVHALEDRCAHRQVPLHAGVVCPEGIRCGYHGWTYDRTGHCVNVPYRDKAKTMPNGVRFYPCREAHGLIFVFPGDPARAERVAFPEIPILADPAYKVRYLDRRVQAEPVAQFSEALAHAKKALQLEPWSASARGIRGGGPRESPRTRACR